MSDEANDLARLSRWIDAPNLGLGPDVLNWVRVSKVAEECGEAVAAFIGVTGTNPRKGVTHTMDDVIAELLDVALTALCAVEHFNDSDGRSMALFAAHVRSRCDRVGLAAAAVEGREP